MGSVTNISAYSFTPLENLPGLKATLLAQAVALELKGTVLLSREGINLFVAGPRRAVDSFVAILRKIPGLAGLAPKYSESPRPPFGRMRVKIKKEIIAFGVPTIDPARRPAPRVSPRELKQWLDEGKPVTLLDTRNTYEIERGTFRGAVAPGIRHFRDFPRMARQLPETLKTARVVTFCTGGIRCEKAAPFLATEGFREVYQLDGGILKYFEECGGAHFEGECFVFDERVTLDEQLRPSDKTEL
jgi:UPF0176 protein